ncbi:MAG: hypothetical protein ABWZ40_09340, partial [Caulobacterales bacterium]
ALPADRDMLNLSEHYEEWTEDTVIGPGEEQPIFFHIDAGVFEDHKSAVLERREEFLLAGTLIYWDVFGKDHTVNFAQVLEHDGADLFEGIFVQWAQEAHVD